MRVLSRLVVAFLLLALWVSASAAATLHIRNWSEPASLDPQKLSGSFQDGIFGDIFEGLVTDAADGSIIPGQAESWTVSPDGLTWTFNLRSDLRWSDGQPVVASDFVYAMRRMVDPATAAEYAFFLEPIRNATAVTTGKLPGTALGVASPDDRTVVITLETPQPAMLQILAQFPGYPLPEHAMDGIDFARADTVVSNGPFVVTEWQPGQYARLARNPDYHAAVEVGPDEVIYHYLPDDAVATNAFRMGEVDISSGFVATDYPALAAEFGEQVRLRPWAGLVWYSMRQDRAPFNDASVRLALSMAVDRDRLGTDGTGLHEPGAWGLVPPNVPGFTGAPWRPDWADLPYPARVEEAKRLLSAAGISDAAPVEIVLRHSTRPDQVGLAEAVAGMWKPLGIVATLKAAEIPDHQQALFGGDFDVASSRWIMDLSDASDMLKVLGSMNPVNYGHWGSLDYDMLLSQAAAEQDEERRFALLREAEALAMAQTPVIPLYWMVSRNLVSPKVTGFVDNVRDIHRSRWLNKAD